MIVHEWNSHELVRRIGAFRRHRADFRLYFHDTHHRSVTDPQSMAAYDLRFYDGVLAYGSVIRDLVSRAWMGSKCLDLARGRGHACVPAATWGRQGRRLGLDWKLGR